jgi:hypothetical protein
LLGAALQLANIILFTKINHHLLTLRLTLNLVLPVAQVGKVVVAQLV